MNHEKMKQVLLDKNYTLMMEELKESQPFDIAEYLDTLDIKNALLVFRLLPKGLAATVFSYLSVEKRAEFSSSVNEKELTDILNDLFFDDKMDLLEEMPAYVVKRILKNSSDVERKLINQFLMYPDYSAGSLMTIEFVDLKKEMLIEDALIKIRRSAPDKETIYTCYVIDSERHLEGTISLKDLVLSPIDKKVGDVMHSDPLYVKAHDDQEDIAGMFKKYDLLALPVVDNEHRLIGIITIDDIVDVIEAENTEDFYKMAAMQATDDEYISTGVFALAGKRIVWLLVLMVSAIFTGNIIKSYEDIINATIVLATFIPMLMDTGGNAGSQASTVVIRSIVLGQIAFKDTFKVIWKEMRVSFIVGFALASINFFRIYLTEGFVIAFTVAIALLFTVIIAKLLGGVLPILAKILKLDPAIMASPVITTIVDALSLIVYFHLATLLVGVGT